MDLIRISIAVALLLCSLVAGFLLAFSIVVMPGIKTLDDRGFLKAFKVMDRVIQNNQPIFMIVWLGSVLALLVLGVLGFIRFEGIERVLVITTVAAYLLGVQLPTATINVPLNNGLQNQDLDTLSASSLQESRSAFEPRWIRWNTIRTVLSILTTVLLIVLAFRV